MRRDVLFEGRRRRRVFVDSIYEVSAYSNKIVKNILNSGRPQG